MKRYRLRRLGSLLITKAALHGPAGTKVLNLLVDTGSTYTIAASEALESIGCSPAESREHLRIVTGSGSIVAPVVNVPRFQCLGHEVKGIKIVAHTLPSDSAVDGLLWMDFLQKFKAVINTDTGVLEVV